MATEQEELRLVVTLADNASAGLDKLREQIKELGGGGSAGGNKHIEKLNEGTKALTETVMKMTGSFGEAFKSLGMLRLGFLGGVAGVAAFGYEMAKQLKDLGEYSDKIRNLGQIGKNIGVDPGAIKNVADQLKVFGVSFDQTVASMSKFAGRMADLQRDPRVRMDILTKTDPAQQANMNQWLDKLNAAKDIEDKLNIARQMRANVERNAIVLQHQSAEQAADTANKIMGGLLAYDPELSYAGVLQKRTAEEKAASDARTKAATEFSKQLGQMDRLLDDIHEKFMDPLLGGPLLATVKAINETLGWIIEKLNLVEGADRQAERVDKALPAPEGLQRFNPFNQRNIDREQRMNNPTFEDRWQERIPEELEKNTEATKKLTSLFENAAGDGAAGGGGFQNAVFTPGGGFSGGNLARRGTTPRFGSAEYPNLGTGGDAPYGSNVGAGVGAGAGGTPPRGGPGGSGGITAPAGTPIQHGGMAQMTTSTGKKFSVDARFAKNFQGFINDYESAGGVVGPSSGTLGERPSNASGHPIGAAMDINQIARNVRRGGVSLPPEVEHQLAKKWGMVSGADWRNPDAGHFGIQSQAAARQALIDQGILPKEETAGGGGTAKGSWFGSSPGWNDPSEPIGRKTASGQSNQVPGIALPSRAGLGKMFEVTTPDGRKFLLPQTDVGPAASTGRGIDITSSAATAMGYSAKNFPTDAQFSYRRRLDAEQNNSTKVEGTGKIRVDVNAPKGTNVAAESSGLFKTIEMYRQTQMQAAQRGPSVWGDTP